MLGLSQGPKLSMKRGYGVSWFICCALVGHVGTMLGLSVLLLGNMEDVHGSVTAGHKPNITQHDPNIGPSKAQLLRAKKI